MVIFCFEVDIILSIIAIMNIVSSADMDVANIRFFLLFFCKYLKNAITPGIGDQLLRRWFTQSFSFLIFSKLPTFYFISVYTFLLLFFFQTQGFIQFKVAVLDTTLFMLLNHLLYYFYLLHCYNLLCLFFLTWNILYISRVSCVRLVLPLPC